MMLIRLILASLPLIVTAVASASAAGMPIPAARLSDVEAHVVRGPWSSTRGSDGSCPPLYMLTSRHCPHCRAFMKEQFLPFVRQGYDVRLHYAPVDAEDQDQMAELAFRRDIRRTLLHQAGRTTPAPPRLNGPKDRLMAYIGMIDALTTMQGLSRGAGYPAYLPTFVWQDRSGRWRVHSGYGAGSADALLASLPKPAPVCAQSE